MGVKLFVGGLSFTTTNESLREAFARFGTVQSAIVMLDRATQRSRGFGFVEMATNEEAERAIGGLNGHSLDGRMIRVDKATPRGSGPPPRPSRPMGPRSGGGGGGGWTPPPGGPPRFGEPPRGDRPAPRGPGRPGGGPGRPGGGRRRPGGGEEERRTARPKGGRRPGTTRRMEDKGRREDRW